MPAYRCFSIERRDDIAELTLTRPQLLNRFDAAAHVEFTAVLRDLRGQRDLRAIVLASTGKVFSAGGDFELMEECHRSVANRLRITDDGRELVGALLDLPQPIVVALHGDAIGLAASIVLSCDAVVAARSARISDPHVAIGLVAGDGGCFAWPSSAGMLVAKRHLLTGDPVPADLAHQWGMVTDLVEHPEDALPVARALAERIAALPPLAVQGTKRALNRVLQHRASEVLDLSFTQEIISLGSDDLLEAIAAFKEKRAPHYQGR